jgi:ribonuclease E
MAKRMLIDATHPEETRVVVLSGNRLEEFDFETSTKLQVKGNIYLAKVTRVEPSLQAAFVDYGGNRHGFLAFAEIHPDYYRIPVGDRGAIDDEPVGDEVETREAVPEEAGASLAAALPEPVSVDAPAESGEDEAGEITASEQPPPGLDPVVPSSASEIRELPSSSSEIRELSSFSSEIREPARAPTLTGLPWDDLAPRPDPVALEPAVPSQPIALGAVALESAVVGPDEPAAASGFWDPLAVAYDTPGENTVEAGAEISEAVGLRVDGDHDGENETVETIDGDDLEEAERQRSRTFRHYKIQEVIKRRQIMLVQVSKEERGTKGAALTTYLSLAGRYCVLMPNTARGGGVSRKITSITDRRRLKDVLEELDIPEGMGVIVRTAGAERSKAEIKRDYEYLLRLWNEIRDLTLKSTAPALIYEEGNLIKRSIRDLYTRDIDEVLVEGEEGYRTAKAFMKMLMPSHARRVQPYRDIEIGLLHRFQVESQIDAIHSPIVQLRSGGYVVINQAEALVAIDVNSGRSTRDRNIEETAVRTNLEAAEEIARQLRLRDLAGLIVIDFIDMEENRNQVAVERRLKEALKNDRARIQVGRISPFGLLEMSRQRLRPSLVETSTQPCPHCGGTGFIRSTESTALYVLRSIEEEGMRRRSAEICVYVPTTVALYILNQKRDSLVQLETRYGLRVLVARDDVLIPPAFRLERLRAYGPAEAAVSPTPPLTQAPDIEEEEAEDAIEQGAQASESDRQEPESDEERARSRRRRRRRRRRDEEPVSASGARSEVVEEAGGELASVGGRAGGEDDGNGEEENDAEGRRRGRRGRRGGRRRGRRDSDLEPIFGEPRTPSEIVEILPLSAMEGHGSALIADLASTSNKNGGAEVEPSDLAELVAVPYPDPVEATAGAEPADRERELSFPVETGRTPETEHADLASTSSKNGGTEAEPSELAELAVRYPHPIETTAGAEPADRERELPAPAETERTPQPERPVEPASEGPLVPRRGWWQQTWQRLTHP